MERIAPRFCVDKARIVCEVGTLVEYLIMASTKTLLSTPKTHPTNAELATPLRETADLLEAQGASIFRVRAYRNAADRKSPARG